MRSGRRSPDQSALLDGRKKLTGVDEDPIEEAKSQAASRSPRRGARVGCAGIALALALRPRRLPRRPDGTDEQKPSSRSC